MAFVFTSLVQVQADVELRIIGGKPAAQGEWPAAVALLDKSKIDAIEAGNAQDANGNPIPEYQANFFAQFCGASLIAPKWVLTAAHCVENLSPANVLALTGATDLLTDRTRVVVTNIIVHPAWNNTTRDSDIALLELAQDATAPAQTMDLFTGDPAVGKTATVVGWGARNFDNSDPQNPVSNDFPHVLHEVEVPVVAQSTCKAVYGGGSITDNMLCAGFSFGSKDSCQGDSGGPLMAQQNGVYRQIGIVSFGNGCALPDAYGVYTRVARFSSWIKDFTEGPGGSSGNPPPGGGSGGTPLPGGGGGGSDSGGSGAMGWLLVPLVLVGVFRRRLSRQI